MDTEEHLDDAADPRATLGIRPGGRPPLPLGASAPGAGGGSSSRPQLRLQMVDSNTSAQSSRPPSPHNTNPHVSYQLAVPPLSASTTTSPGGRSPSGADRNVSGATATSGFTNISELASAAGDAGVKRRRRATLARKQQASALTANRGQYETQKLLGHLLDRLESRRKGFDMLNRAVASAKVTSANQTRNKNAVAQLGKAVAGAAVRTTAAAGKALTGGDDDDDEEDEDDILAVDGIDWDTDATYDLLEQTRGLLTLADRQGLDLFGESGLAAAEMASSAAKAKAKRMGRFSSIGPVNSRTSNDGVFGGIPGPTLLRRLAGVVASLVATDCHYTTYRFRLLKPPFALQTMVMDVAALLYHKGDLEIKIMMMNAIIQALYTMGAPMRDRICQWLEGRMGELLRRLATERGTDDGTSDVNFNDPFSPVSSEDSPSVPRFAFSAPDDGKAGENRGWMRYSPAGTPTPYHEKIVGILSTHSAGHIPAAATQIASLVPRMLVALTTTIDLTTANLTTIHCVHRLISLVLTAKPDAGVDLLEIIANAEPGARRRGMDILATYYSKTVGHNTIARRPALTTYAAHRTKWETGQDRALMEDDTEGHYYIPWRVTSSRSRCLGCNQICHGFCVKCTMCNDVKHFFCLKLSHQEVFEYTVNVLATADKPSRVETVCVRFSLVPPRPDELVISGGGRGTSDAAERKIGQHHLRLVNLFTLTLCDKCRQPLWGTTAQAYVCVNQCQRFFHPACADVLDFVSDQQCQSGKGVYVNPEAHETDDILDPFSITAVEIHQSWLQARNKICYESSKLSNMSYDEVSFLYANLWIQHEIYLSGVSVGSLRILDVPMEDDITGIAMLLNDYENKLGRELAVSPAMVDFANVSSEEIPDKGCLMWQVRYLQYCAALIRAPVSPVEHDHGHPHGHAHAQGGHLTVDGARPSSPTGSIADAPSRTYEQIPMPVVNQCLATDLHLRDDLAAAALLEQLRQFGLISIPNRRIVDALALDDKNLAVTAPLPLLMDSSPAVELLVLAIEGLLDDIDLTANEQALSLLHKLAWPTTMCSAYAMIRLGGAVMSWIMDEDDVLHHIVKNYASMRKRPPGVRNPPGMSSGGGNSAVAAYKDDRGLLLHRYARPWLEALCAMDPHSYSDLAYERSKIIDNKYEALDLPKKPDEAAAAMAGIALTRIAALVDADVMFTGSLDLITNWLEDLGGVMDTGVVFKPLPRLLRHANGFEADRDVWLEAAMVSEEGDEGFQRVCRWFRALTFSGVMVPWESITSLVDKHSVGHSGDEALFHLVAAMDANMAPIEPVAFAEANNNIFIPLAVSMSMRKTKPSPEEIDMLTISMLSLLKAYGTPADAIAETSLAKRKALASNTKRKNAEAAAPMHANIPLHSEVIFAAARILPHLDRPTDIVLDFLWLLTGKATGAADVLGFLHTICPELYKLLWPLYDRADVNRRSRARLFMRLLTINSKPIEEQVVRSFKGREAHVTRERLLELVLELADEELTNEVNGWRRASVGLIAIFFDVALQPNEPMPETLVIWKALLPAHLQAITNCFEEYLESCPDEQRLQLLVKLMRLRPHLPSWPLVGWSTIEALVTEQLTNIRQFEGHDSVQAISAVLEARNIRVSTLALGLQMLSAGVECEWTALQTFQQHVAAACAQPWPEPTDIVTGILLPALKTVLDSTARTPILDSTGRARETTLVGALFVAIVINFATDLGKHNFVVQRCILDILLVIFFKHNVQPYELSALTTLQTLAAFAAEENSSENRLLALQILRTAQARMPKDRFSRVLPSLFVRIADIMFKETTADGDSAIIDACRELLNASIEEFGKAGLFLQVLRTDGQQSAGNTAPEAIGRAMQVAARLSGEKNKNVWLDQVIRDLPDVFRWPRDGMAHVFQSIARLSTTLEDGLTEDGAEAFCDFLNRLGRHAAEWDAPHEINLNPVLQMCSALLRICPTGSQLELLGEVATFLHIVLSRYAANLEQIRKIIPVSIRVARYQQVDNSIVSVLFEICGATLKGLAVSPVTLRSLLVWLGDEEDEHLKRERLTLLVEASPGCSAILTRAHPTLVNMRRDPELLMGLLKAAATVIVRAELEQEGNTGLVLRNLPKEAAATQLDVFAHILYASLEVRLGAARTSFTSLFPVLGRATSLSLFACADLLSVPDPSGDGAHLASSAFVVMRLAVLAVHDPPPKDGTFASFDASSVEAHDVLLSFWHRLWPEWERLLGLSLAPSCINLPQRAVTLSVLMDIILFISANQPKLLVEPAPTLARGLAQLEEWHTSAGTSVPVKLHKAEAALDAAILRSQPAANVRRTAKSAIWNDMLATERLVSLRALM